MRIPDEFGLNKGWTYEVIITTSENAAPIGIRTRDFDSVELELYKGSNTLEKILKEGKFVINFVDDIRIVYNSLFEKEKIKCEKNYIKYADAFIEAELKEKEDLGNRIRIKTTPVDFKIIRTPRLNNRARALTLESLIAKTKIPHVVEEEREFLERKIEENLRTVKKVAPESSYEKIMEKI